MSVTATAGIDLVTPRPRFLPEGIQEFQTTIQLTGDASAGVAHCALETRPAGVGDLYVAVSSLAVSAPAANSCGFNVIGDEFEMTDGTGALYLDTADMIQTGSYSAAVVTRKISLGRVISGNGTIRATFKTNTDSGAYRATFRGWVSTRPFTAPDWIAA